MIDFVVGLNSLLPSQCESLTLTFPSQRLFFLIIENFALFEKVCECFTVFNFYRDEDSGDEQESVKWLLDTVRDNDPKVLEKINNKITNGETDVSTVVTDVSLHHILSEIYKIVMGRFPYILCYKLKIVSFSVDLEHI